MLFGDYVPAPNWSQSTTWKVQSQLNDVAVQNSTNSIPVSQAKLDVPSSEESNKQAEPDVKNTVSDESYISAFMTQVSELVKLVDSRDIMELQLKQLDCELVIRKKEALPQPPAATQMVMMHHSSPQAMIPSQFPPSQSFAPVSSPPTPSAAAPVQPAPAKTNKSSLPPLKCPMAGTFYRSPGPGEPPFVKVGDKVKKGQVICIIEAMKLMNEIEADQSGTIVEILAEDGKPVSLDTPLLVIEP
ncbi:Biotin/lipoyl attachment [Macleaya cordata]|uniref:Biotin carboxyl carrier protein of acetyl-CoA carboxylase n=1 Tax=Macleaya cordata TaxID=56857 RepID=A0A200PRF9_MACCD|nr:Biotin/lipoyl attachment [Macleaya cordata]